MIRSDCIVATWTPGWAGLIIVFAEGGANEILVIRSWKREVGVAVGNARVRALNCRDGQGISY